MSINKVLVVFSIVGPLVAASASAYAGSTISDRSYWPDEARRAVPSATIIAPRNPSAAFASDQKTMPFQPTLVQSGAGSAPHYHGGPKSL